MSHHDPNLGGSDPSGNRGSDDAIRRAHDKARRAADVHDDQARPTIDTPLNGRKRSPLVPILVVVGFVVALLLFWLFGLEVLVPSG